MRKKIIILVGILLSTIFITLIFLPKASVEIPVTSPSATHMHTIEPTVKPTEKPSPSPTANPTETPIVEVISTPEATPIQTPIVSETPQPTTAPIIQPTPMPSPPSEPMITPIPAMPETENNPTQTNEETYYSLMLERGCSMCGSTDCAGFDHVNRTYNSANCDKFSTACEVCGREIGNGQNGTCIIRESGTCYYCGTEFDGTCHTCP